MVRKGFLMLRKLALLDHKINEQQVRIDDLKNQRSLLKYELKNEVLPGLEQEANILNSMVRRINSEDC
jgi:hypothetical protein